MNQGIYYLYEYETGQRKRNLGFLQISHQYRSCMMTLHLKSLSLSPGTALELHGFYNKDRDLIHAPCAILNYSGGSIATRLSISESLFPCGKSFSGLEGFLLLPEGKAEPLFWLPQLLALPVGFSLISAEELSRSPEEVSPVESFPSPEEVSPVESSPSPEEVSPVESSPYLKKSPFMPQKSNRRKARQSKLLDLKLRRPVLKLSLPLLRLSL